MYPIRETTRDYHIKKSQARDGEGGYDTDEQNRAGVMFKIAMMVILYPVDIFSVAGELEKRSELRRFELDMCQRRRNRMLIVDNSVLHEVNL